MPSPDIGGGGTFLAHLMAAVGENHQDQREGALGPLEVPGGQEGVRLHPTAEAHVLCPIAASRAMERLAGKAGGTP